VDRTGVSPLLGKRVVITRTARQSVELTEKLERLGAVPISFPLIAISPLDDYGPLDIALGVLQEFDWIIFTSENAVRVVAERVAARRVSDASVKNIRTAVVGPATASAAEHAGFSITYQAKSHSGAALAEELAGQIRGRRLLLPRSDRANADLPGMLAKYGATVTEMVAYRTVAPDDTDRNELISTMDTGCEAILFFSPTAVQHFNEIVGGEKFAQLQSRTCITAVGPITADALNRAGVHRLIVAVDTTSDAVIDALEQYFAATMKVSAGGVQE
jgi:uroporphyrinogen-III synthase